MDNYDADNKILRARAILNCYIASIDDDDRADDRFVLWAVDAYLADASKILDQVEVSHGLASAAEGGGNG